MANYGKELIIDLHFCDVSRFNRRDLKIYFKKLCKIIDMQREKLVFWDDLKTAEEFKQTSPHTLGTSAVQFILTSNITIHTLDIMKRVYINIFSCKEFKCEDALKFSVNFFKGTAVNYQIMERI
jgi:S-adenosylmethionine/arginine decarboxylase-like enzyme